MDEATRARAKELQAVLTGLPPITVAAVGILNGLFEALCAGAETPAALARKLALDLGYVQVWCDGAWGFGWLEREEDRVRLSKAAEALLVQDGEAFLGGGVLRALLQLQFADTFAECMRTGEHPSLGAAASHPRLSRWFGTILEWNYRPFFLREILPAVPEYGEMAGRGGTVLDLGCGNAWFLRVLAEQFATLRGVGVDDFAANVAAAREGVKSAGLEDRITIQEGEIAEVEPPAELDLVTMNRVIHHVWPIRQALLQRLHASLRPGGCVIVWDPNNLEMPAAARERSRWPVLNQVLTEYMQGNRLLTAGELEGALREAGFRTRAQLFRERCEVVVVGRKGGGAGRA